MDKFTILAVLALGGFGCDDKGDSVGEESDSDTDADTDTDTDTDVAPDEINVALSSTTGFSVEIVGGSGDYKFGVVEGGAKAWTAEDCIGGTYAGYGPFCKTAAATETTTFPCAAADKDVDNTNTLFCGVAEASLTYYFASMDDSWCGVSGPDADYYDAEACETL